jgi:hypothetical protein
MVEGFGALMIAELAPATNERIGCSAATNADWLAPDP